MKILNTILAGTTALAMIAAPLIAPAANQSSTKQGAKHTRAYQSAAAKFDQIQANANSGKHETVTLTAEECSAYVSEGGVVLPTGVENVKFSSTPGEITAVTKVDFDKITAGKSSMNPLMMLFTGVHDVTTKASAAGGAGRGQVNIESVQIDGVTVPRTALEYFVSKYITPKYGNNVGMNNTFALPAHIQTATVGQNTVTVTQ